MGNVYRAAYTRLAVEQAEDLGRSGSWSVIWLPFILHAVFTLSVYAADAAILSVYLANSRYLKRDQGESW